MRQFKAILFALLLVAPAVGCFCLLQWQKASVRHEFREMLIRGMDRDSLTQLTFSLEEANHLLEWEHEREFEYGGQMFDVVESKQYGDSVTYYCWKDDKETHLNTLLASMTAKALDHDPLKSSKRTKATDILKVRYIAPTHDIEIPDLIFGRSDHTHFISAASRFLMPPPVPPPVPA